MARLVQNLCLLLLPILGHALSYQELLESCPHNLQEAIEEGVRSLNHSGEDLVFNELIGGFSSSNLFTFSIDNQRYVLRVLDPKRLQDPGPTLNKRLNEIEAHRQGCLLGIAPKLFFADPQGLIVIMEYLDAETLNDKHLKDPHILKELGKALYQLHQCPFVLRERRTQADRVQKHYEAALRKGIAFPSQFHEEYVAYMQGEEGDRSAERFCHGDLNPANILIRDGRPYFIDWAGATYADPFSDLAYLSLLAGMDPFEIDSLMDGYLGRAPTAEERERLKHMQARTCFLTATVWFDFSETEREREKPMEERVDALDQALLSETLKRGKAYIDEKVSVNPMKAPTEEIRKYALGFFKDYLINSGREESREEVASRQMQAPHGSGYYNQK